MKTYGFEVHNHYNPLENAPVWAIELAFMLELLLQQGFKTMTALTDLQAAVAAEDTVIASAVTLLNGIPALILAAGTDPAALTALATDIQTNTAALAAAVITGTPGPGTAAVASAPIKPVDASGAAAAAVAAAPAATASTPTPPAASPAKTS